MGHIEMNNGSLYGGNMENTMFDAEEALNLAIYKMLTFPTDLVGYVNIDQYLNVTNIVGGASATVNITYSQGVVIANGVNEASIQMWKYAGGWTQSGITNQILNVGDDIVGATFGGIIGHTTIAPLGAATTYLLGDIEFVCEQKWMYVSCTWSGQNADADPIVGDTIDWDLAEEDGTILASGEFAEPINGTYIMSYTMPDLDEDFVYVVSSYNNNTLAYPITIDKSDLAVIWIAIFIALAVAYYFANVWIYRLIIAGGIFINGLLGIYVVNNQITMFMMFITTIFLFKEIVSYIGEAVSNR